MRESVSGFTIPEDDLGVAGETAPEFGEVVEAVENELGESRENPVADLRQV